MAVLQLKAIYIILLIHQKYVNSGKQWSVFIFLVLETGSNVAQAHCVAITTLNL